MNQSELEYIVGLVTQQVLSAMDGDKAPQSPQTEGFSKSLILGDTNVIIPEDLSENAVAYGVEDYCAGGRNILRYDRVIITALTTTQLADIALARVSDDVTCAVLNALLNGIDVYLLEGALTFRKYAGKGSTALYKTLENYARTLQVFGVKMAGQRPKQILTEVKPPKYKAPPILVPKGHGQPNPGRLITEGQARELLKCEGPIHLPADAIVTPLARDLFSHAGAEIVRDL